MQEGVNVTVYNFVHVNITTTDNLHMFYDNLQAMWFCNCTLNLLK